ncbi:hypothetical protein [Wolbachia endosymbiont of Encarsia formosa]|uniref:hypothetical protein n=1 Tax=Wolbachia endosymbiont of Encarsia formosa TaxID=77125 RepID=UPI0031BAA3B7
MLSSQENRSYKKVVSYIAINISFCVLSGIEGYKVGLFYGLVGPSVNVVHLAIALGFVFSYYFISELSANKRNDKIIPVLAVFFSSISVGLAVGCITCFSIPLLLATGAVTIGSSLITAAFEFGLMNKFTNVIVEKIQKKDVNVQPDSKMDEVQDSPNLDNAVKMYLPSYYGSFHYRWFIYFEK